MRTESAENQKRLFGLGAIIGNTPLFKIDYRYRNKTRTIYAKAEYLNFTGSIKDRIAYYILEKAYKTGDLRQGMYIMEATSGNTGISFSALGRALGHDVTIFMPNWMSAERINLIRSFGAAIRLVTPEEGGFTGCISLAEKARQEHPDNIFLPRQFDNCMNCEAHAATTGPEIVRQLIQLGMMPDAFVAGVGTGGTVMGVGKYLKNIYPETKVYPLEPANSPTLSAGHKVGKHRIQGISDEFIPSIVKLNELDDIVQVDDGDSILMAQKLAGSLGIGVGISSGGNFLGAVKVQNELGDEAVVTTVFADDSKKYLSTDYAKKEPLKHCFLTPDIVLDKLTVVK
ncbi:MAG: PLP-dependent cysteine synthase family protein [Bacteroidales bacterium]|jgi:cysteine synthase A|nr:PLP-dependent cysteine synthase family protein [Bacteroidales bacterium]